MNNKILFSFMILISMVKGSYRQQFSTGTSSSSSSRSVPELRVFEFSYRNLSDVISGHPSDKFDFAFAGTIKQPPKDFCGIFMRQTENGIEMVDWNTPEGNTPVVVKFARTQEIWRVFLYRGYMFFAQNVPSIIDTCVLTQDQYETYFRAHDRFGAENHPIPTAGISAERKVELIAKARKLRSETGKSVRDFAAEGYSYGATVIDRFEELAGIDASQFSPETLEQSDSKLCENLDNVGKILQETLQVFYKNVELRRLNAGSIPEVQGEEVRAGDDLAEMLRVLGQISDPFRNAIQNIGTGKIIINND